jgi:hypothetical protein
MKNVGILVLGLAVIFPVSSVAQTLVSDEQAALSGFGTAVAVTEGDVLIAEPLFADRPGVVYVYRRNASGQWVVTQELSVRGGTDDNRLGRALDVDGNRALLGATKQDDDLGAAYVFERDESGTWREVARLLPDDVGWLKWGRAGALAGEVALVAPRARGSQTGLVLPELPDGNWLLAWSAFDGSDDEILWSIGRLDHWSTPRRLGPENSVPDIMPALVSTPDGALLTWSRMIDGQYRLTLSHFEAGDWSRPRLVGPPGSLEPGFTVQDGQLLLLYRHAWPQGWAVTELSTQGRTLRLAFLSDSGPSRPVLTGSSGDDVELRWPDRRRRTVGWEALP